MLEWVVLAGLACCAGLAWEKARASGKGVGVSDGGIGVGVGGIGVAVGGIGVGVNGRTVGAGVTGVDVGGPGVGLTVGNSQDPMGLDSEQRTAMITNATTAPIAGNREDRFGFLRRERTTAGASTCTGASLYPSKAARSWEAVCQRLVVSSSIALRTVASV